MYIAPNTTIHIMRDIPLDSTYGHTIYFNSTADQEAYFLGNSTFKLEHLSYQRVDNGTLKVQLTADQLYSCNYMMFQNSNYYAKWFYAFIDSVDYINNTTAMIHYTIDVMQTWHFDYILGECMVEREHSSTDIIGDNTMPERLELGPYYSDEIEVEETNPYICIAHTFSIESADLPDASGTIVSGLYQGCKFAYFLNNEQGAQYASNFIDYAVSHGKGEGIVAIFLAPEQITGANPSTRSVNLPRAYGLRRSDGAAIKNNKCYTSPFTTIYISTMTGNSASFPFEYFGGATCNFNISYVITPNPCQILVPLNYKGVTINDDEMLPLEGYPQLSWNTDAFKAWLAMNSANLAVSALASVTAVAGAAVTGGALLPLAGSALSDTAHKVLEGYKEDLKPPQSHSGSGASGLAATHKLRYHYYIKHIRPEYVSRIDDYFNVFGYATGRVKVPNRNVRPHWTYTKTVGCIIHGVVPAADQDIISKIYDNGITFWRRGDEIGNYSLDNRPV